eukprot:TRINITY_DN3410_c0_g1_i5.p1 TRINITY_DN3410_c0_g1~~TRINITY_DN3410_c0_g1_i5.p1  ORF type:complete len:467 (-),score=139.08 TRINITY_DN3410_c0_g1_i5:399-1799(-)
MQKPAQIIVIPQNMLSKQSLNILKQRQVLPNTKQILPQQQMKPLATVIGNTTAVNGRPIMAVPPVSVSQPQQQLILPSPPVSPPLKRSLSPASSEISNDEMAGQGLVDVKVEDGDENYQPSRKRANLDHLSAEEKLQRRKLKNRVAAQNARDKKKAYIDELEIHLENLRQAKLQVEEERARLAKENDHLNTINSRLSLENTRLMERNLELEKRLGLETTVVSATNDASYILPCSPQSLPSRTPSPPYGNNDAIEFSDDIKSNLYNLQDSSSHLLVAATDAANAAVDTTASTVILDTCPEPAVLEPPPLPQETGVQITLPPPVKTEAVAVPIQSSTPQKKPEPPVDTVLSSHDLTTLSPSSCMNAVMMKTESKTPAAAPQVALLLWLASLILPHLVTSTPPSCHQSKSSNISKTLTSSLATQTTTTTKTESQQPGKPPPPPPHLPPKKRNRPQSVTVSQQQQQLDLD